MTHEPHPLQDVDNDLIERARRALSPRDADQARVLAALSERLYGPHGSSSAEGAASGRILHSALPQPLPAAAEGAAVSHATASPASWSKLWSWSRLWNWTWKCVLPLSTAAVVAFLWATPRAHRDNKPPARTHVNASVTPSLTPEVVKQSVEELLAHEPVQPTAPRTTLPAQSKEPGKDKKRSTRKRCHAADGSERPCPAPASPTALAATPAPSAEFQLSLRHELDALRKAERALREKQPARALETLEAFERTAAGGGKMQEERSAAATVARCALTASDGKELHDAFVRRYPSSAYALRIKQTCLKKPRGWSDKRE